MIIPSVDIMDGQVVQLVGGRELALSAGDPVAMARKLAVVGPIAVVDLDAALGRGDNRALVEAICREVPARVGGGIRDLATARRWLDAGAERIILGTAARPELLSQLPRERVMAAVDVRGDEVMVKGWTEGTGRRLQDVMEELSPYVGGFLVTFIDLEGRLQGTDLDRAAQVVRWAGGAEVTIAGGITQPAEIGALDRLGADAQVGMALYTGRMSLADAVLSVMKPTADGLWPTVVTDGLGQALGLVYSDAESVRVALERGVGAYHSRRRGLWVKGETSGATQRLRRLVPDCDRDALRVEVDQSGSGFCHRDTWTCWGAEQGLGALWRRLRDRAAVPVEGSYTARLLDDPDLLGAKLREEAGELATAAGPEEVVHEAADVLYFTLVRLVQAGVDLTRVGAELDRRARRITRRPGDAEEVA